MSVLRDNFNAIAPSWKKGAPNITKWMDEATAEIDALNARALLMERIVAGLRVPEPYTLDEVAAVLRKLLGGLA